ncbi:MAG TPA: enoyl-CoA hydratase/isomerase family protein [Gemmatimonadales bacterium]|nr:enoyl-CoA hydratase/isomerase family protein [Gemmatimonadales bacterium]
MSLVLVEVTEGIGTVTLNRPHKLNAFDRHTCRELIDALHALVADSGVRVLILTGAGRAFSAGADLNALGEDGPALVAAGKEIALLLRAAPQPVIAAVNGAAAGGGANLALACDYRIAAEGAAIGQVFAKLGLGPDWGGSYFLPRLVGPSRALELVWSARMVPAAEAHALGLFDRLVPADRLLAEARALAALWAGFPPLALRRAKEVIYQSAHGSLAEMLDAEITLQHELFATPEARSRIGASLATRSR